MASITIVTGSPGTGKTTLCRRLAGLEPRGLHIPADPFYAFPAHPIDPTDPASHAQNTAVVRALARAASAFGEADYEVFLDGIFGPWFLPEIAGELVACEVPTRYVVLRAGLDECLGRATGRPDPAPSAPVRHMHRAFADLGTFARHAVETGGRDPEDVSIDIRERLARGDFALALSEILERSASAGA